MDNVFTYWFSPSSLAMILRLRIAKEISRIKIGRENEKYEFPDERVVLYGFQVSP